MGRGATQNAETNTGIGRQNSQTLMGEGQNTLNTLAPALTAEATSPQGFAPEDLAAMNTAARGAAGGANASAAGAGALTEARTRNAGAANPAIEESVRDAMRQGAQSGVQIQGANALQREQNRQAGLQGLQGLYGTNTQAALNALGLSNNAIGQWNQSSANTTRGIQDWTRLGLQAAGALAGGG